MSEVDLVILLVIAASALISFVRGFFREAVSLVTWLGAIVITLVFTARFASLLPVDTIESATARTSISALILFFGSMFVGGLINWLFGRIATSRRLSLPDRVVGILFGVARGAIIVVLLVLAAHLTPNIKTETWWVESRLLPYLQPFARFVHGVLPEQLGQHFDFTPVSS